MTVVAAIVEGDGEVAALPILLRRLKDKFTPDSELHVSTPIRVKRDRFIRRDEEFRKHLLLAARKAGDSGWILILLDADDDCPASLGEALRVKARALIRHKRVAVVIANREYEARFIASAESLDGRRGFVFDRVHVDAEQPRDAKGWIRERMTSRTYSPITDQPAFSALFDLDTARARSRSFRKLCEDWQHHMAVARTGTSSE